MSDLQALFAALKVKRDVAPESDPRTGESRPSFGQTSASSSPAAASHITFTTPSQPASSSFMPTTGQTNGNGNNDRAQSLLSLLNFGQPKSTAANDVVSHPEPIARHNSENQLSARATGKGSNLSASDLVAGFTSSQNLPSKNAREEGSSREDSQSNPQDAILRLLNASHSRSSVANAQDQGGIDQVSTARTSTQNGRYLVNIANGNSGLERQKSPIRLFGTSESRGNTPFEAPKSESAPIQNENSPLFTYKNPFEALNASRNVTPIPQTPVQRSHTSLEQIGAMRRSRSPDSADVEDVSLEQSSSRRKLMPKISNRNASQGLKSPGVLQSKDGMEKIEVFPSIETSDEAHRELSPAEHFKEEDEEESKIETILEEVGKTEPDREETKGDAFDVWEDAEDSTEKESLKRDVPVYNFPIKPFVSITLRNTPTSEVGIRGEGVMEISRLKKEFDQLDRSLAAATSKYISYALIKNGGMRIIRQDDGSDRSVFKNSRDRIFNVSFCTTSTNSPPTDVQAVLGTGMSGSVYYATVSKEGNDLFEQDILDSECLIFPPYPSGDENTSGGVLKTRAKKSSRHPGFFAIGRGKSIHLIWPATAMSPRYGISGAEKTVDVEKFYRERSLKITTGKAGKDFAFSEDDSLIASLDKTGRLRFWDIRPLVNDSNATAANVNPVEIDTPLLSLATASPAEKSWPTSVLFLDKSRPYSKNGALRYVLLGLKQNHTLQLWDIALGKAVQEVNFPHESETDGICSVAYHPSSGIIVVGHPTRNSIYFIHLSAPRYTLQPMSQAAYVHRLAGKDPDLPKPDSTACMSGIREISFAAKGILRSVELLPIHKSTDSLKIQTQTSPLFELYVVHSKGVTCLNITKDDLGWTNENKVIHSINAVEAGVIDFKELRLGSFIDESADRGQSTEETLLVTKSIRKKASKKSPSSDDAAAPATVETDAGTATTPVATTADEMLNGSNAADTTNSQTPAQKETKKVKKKAAAAAAKIAKKLDSPLRNTSPTKTSMSAQFRDTEISAGAESMDAKLFPEGPRKNAEADTKTKTDAVAVDISEDWLDKEMKKIGNIVSAEFRKELSLLYRNLQNDRSVQDSAAVARQEAVLRLVSTMLSTNIEQVLSQMIATQMQQVVVPALTSVTAQAVTSHIGEAVAKGLHQRIPQTFETHIPVALNAALQNPQVSRTISEAVSHKLASQIEKNVNETIYNSLTPAFRSLATSAAENATADLETHLGAQIRQLETDRRTDSAKLDSLSKILRGMAETMQAMSDSQVAFQGQILKDRRQFVPMSDAASEGSARRVPTHHQLPAPSAPPILIRPSVDDIELDEISQLMVDGKYEQGSIRWLQSTRQVELFDQLFVRYTPDYLTTDVSPLVAFSVGITVANSLSRNTARRLQWINSALDAINFDDPELAELSQHAPGLLNSVLQKLDSLYMQAAEMGSQDPLLRMIPPITRKTKDILATLI